MNRATRRILATLLMTVLVIGTLTVGINIPGGAERAAAGGAEIPYGYSDTAAGYFSIYNIDGGTQYLNEPTDFSKTDNGTEIEYHATIPISSDVFPVSIKFDYNFDYNTNTVVTLPGESPDSSSAGQNKYMIFYDWTDTYTIEVTADGKTPALYVFHIEDNGDEFSEYVELEGFSVEINGVEYPAVKPGGAEGIITPFSLLPIPQKTELVVTLPDDVMLTDVLEATVSSVSFIGDADADIANSSGKKLDPGTRLFSTIENLELVYSDTMSLYVGPVNQLNTARVKYGLRFEGGTDNISGFSNSYLFANHTIYSNSRGYADFYAEDSNDILQNLVLDIVNFDATGNYNLNIYSDYSFYNAKSGVLAVYEGQGTGGTDITDLILNVNYQTYQTQLDTPKWFTITMQVGSTQQTHSFLVQANGQDAPEWEGYGLQWYVPGTDMLWLQTSGYYVNPTEGFYLYPYGFGRNHDEYWALLDSSVNLSALDMEAYVTHRDHDNGHTKWPISKISANGGAPQAQDQITVNATGKVTLEGFAGINDVKVAEESFYLTKMANGAGPIYVTAPSSVSLEFGSWMNDAAEGRYVPTFYFYNMGTQDINTLTVKLSSGSVLELHNYWSVNSPETLMAINPDVQEDQWNQGAVQVDIKSSAQNGTYSDTLLFQINGETVHSIQLSFTVADQSGGGTTPPGGGGGGTVIGGGSSSGSSSGNSGYSYRNNRTNNNPFSGRVGSTGSNVNTDGTVNATSVKKDLDSALASSTGTTATVSIRNASSISPSTLQTLAQTALAAGKTAILHADTTNALGGVTGRLYVEPARLVGRTTDLKLGVFVDGTRVTTVKNRFENQFAGNKFTVVQLEQEGSLGANMQVAVKVDLSALNTQNLVFYTYNEATNQYTLIQEPNYSIDANGYLHFYTDTGGYILITDKPTS